MWHGVIVMAWRNNVNEKHHQKSENSSEGISVKS